ncbi:hypothetical protein CLOM_g1120 [Closterium sp. NIES-68]|nr:hypothetical protein CLOM_g1120 [Closterium sp. NIES-68]GJP62092.1 hypothetical protein CLOP_g19191 [Closterium sp. NIES-67]
MALGTVYPEQDSVERSEPDNAIMPPGSPSLSAIAATAASLTTDSYSILASADLTSALSLAEHVARLTTSPHLYVHRSSVEKVAVCVRQLLPTLHLLKTSAPSLSFDPRSAFVLRRLASELKDVIALLKACKLTIPGMFFSLGHHHKNLARRADACVTEIRHCHTVCSMLLGQASTTTTTTTKIAADSLPLSTSLVSHAAPPPQNHFPLRTVSCSHTSGSSKEPSSALLESYSGSGTTGGSGSSGMFPRAEQPARVLQQVAEMFPQSPMIGPSAGTFSAKDSASAKPSGMMTWQQMQVRGIPLRSISASAASGFGGPAAGGLYGRGGSAGRQRPGLLTGTPTLALLGGERGEHDSSAADAAASAALALIGATGSGGGGGAGSAGGWGGGGDGDGSRFASRTYTVSSGSTGRMQSYYGSIAVSPRPLSPATAAAAAAAAAFAAPRMFSPRRPRASYPLPSALNRSSISAAAAASANVCRVVDSLAEGSAEDKRAALAALMDVIVTDEGKLQAAAAGAVPVLSVLLSLPEDDFLLDNDSMLHGCVDDDWSLGGGVLPGGGSGEGSVGSRGTGKGRGGSGGGLPGGIGCGRGAVAALLPLPPLPEPPPRESLNLLVARALVQLSALPANCQVIAKAGCVPSLIAMLRGGNPEAQAVAVNLLLNLATGCDSDGDSVSPAIVAGDAIPSLVAIVQSASEAKVRRQAMEALAHVVAKAKENQDAAARAGAIPILTETLREGSLLVQEKAAFALGSIAENNDENKVMIAGTGAVPPLLDLLLCGPADISLQERVSRRAAWALFVLSSHRLSASYIVASGGLDVVKRANVEGPSDTREWTAKIIPVLEPVADMHQQEQQQAAWQQKWTNQRRGRRDDTDLRTSYDDVASPQEVQRWNEQIPSRFHEQESSCPEGSALGEKDTEHGQRRKQWQEDVQAEAKEDQRARDTFREEKGAGCQGEAGKVFRRSYEELEKIGGRVQPLGSEVKSSEAQVKQQQLTAREELEENEVQQQHKQEQQLQEGKQQKEQKQHKKQQQSPQQTKRPVWQFSVHPSSPNSGGSLRQLCKQRQQSPQQQQQQQQQSKSTSNARPCRAHKQES